MTSAANTLRQRARIRDLLARTVDRGCSEAEAATAASMAERLMAEAGIDLDSLSSETPSSVIIAIGVKRSHADQLLSAVAARASVRIWTQSESCLGRTVSRAAVYFGHERDLLIAEYLHEVVHRTLAQLTAAFRKTAEYKRRRTPRTKRECLEAYRYGVVVGLVQALLSARPKGPEVADKLRRLDHDLHASVPNLTTAKPLKRRQPGARYQGALSAGLEAGANSGIHDGVGGAPAPRMIGGLT
jgi:hypothetical protein